MDTMQTQLPGVTAAQFHSFAKRMPSYYASVIATMLTTILVFRRLSPWLAYGIPGPIILLGTVRGWWWTWHRNDLVTDAEAEIYLRRSSITLVVAMVVVVGMDAALFQLGDVYTRCFLLIQLLCSATCGFYCLMHLRRVALVVFAAMMLPFAALMISLGHASTSMAAVTTLVTAVVLIFAMLGYERDFFSLVEAKVTMGQLNEENLKLAQMDMLTGLPNRRYFFEHIAGALEGESAVALPTVGILDLDGFKPVNDTYGHRVGDRVLEVIAGRLKMQRGDVEHFCRLGGDEFVFMTGETDPERLQTLGRTLIDAISECITLGHRTICVGCSIGFASRKEGEVTDGFDLFEQADYALYHAKRNGRSRTVLFSEEHETQIRNQGLLDQTLRQADLETEFYLVYQPIVDLRTLEVKAMECLARWRSPVLGDVSPERFVPVAEQVGLIGELTKTLMRRALKTAEEWPESVHLSFNVSPHEMANLEHVRNLIEIVQGSGIAPTRVGIELTETALLNNFKEVSRHMAMLRETGASIYLDDFGTGHSSLSYIHALPLDRIKVDRSFIQSIGTNDASYSIIRSIINLCRDLGIACVVEGAETVSQLEVLQELKAELIQGYFFSRPLPAEEALEYLRQTDGYAQISSKRARAAETGRSR